VSPGQALRGSRGGGSRLQGRQVAAPAGARGPAAPLPAAARGPPPLCRRALFPPPPRRLTPLVAGQRPQVADLDAEQVPRPRGHAVLVDDLWGGDGVRQSQTVSEFCGRREAGAVAAAPLAAWEVVGAGANQHPAALQYCLPLACAPGWAPTASG
jgi:hypothetical protein